MGVFSPVSPLLYLWNAIPFYIPLHSIPLSYISFHFTPCHSTTWDGISGKGGHDRGEPGFPQLLSLYPSSSSSSSSYLSLSPLSWVQSSVIVQLPSWPDVSLTGLRSDASLWIFWTYYFYLYRHDIVVDRQTPPFPPRLTPSGYYTSSDMERVGGDTWLLDLLSMN